MKVITPKQLARELDINFKHARRLIRQKFKRKPGHYWEWDEHDAEEVRQWLRQKLKIEQ